MPLPFHCHECDKPTMNDTGLCDKHSPNPFDKYIRMEPVGINWDTFGTKLMTLKGNAEKRFCASVSARILELKSS
jgi:hypothetical protein